MKHFFADLHIHIGRAGNGLPVKITAARSLTVANILEECTVRKGIDIVGIVDASSPYVQRDLDNLIESGYLRIMEDGGLRYKDAVSLILGGEVETTDLVRGPDGDMKERSAHCLCYFPFPEDIIKFTHEISLPGRIKNIGLSSQKSHLTMQKLWEIVDRLKGIMIPAHAFTPHKGIYGSCVKSVSEVLSPEAWKSIPAIELGLSSNSFYADMISELTEKSFISNSDAHSLPKIGREYNIIKMESPTFKELVKALYRKDGRAVVGNYGFDPKLGKYHRTYCEECRSTVDEGPPVPACTKCGTKADGRKVIMGVLDRIYQIRDNECPRHPDHRPVYIHQIPLQNLPGIGSKTMNKLLEKHTEMQILHSLNKEELVEIVGEKTADIIMRAREGRLKVEAGGGGHYGRVKLTED